MVVFEDIVVFSSNHRIFNNCFFGGALFGISEIQ